jgi:hypothetical protein
VPFLSRHPRHPRHCSPLPLFSFSSWCPIPIPVVGVVVISLLRPISTPRAIARSGCRGAVAVVVRRPVGAVIVGVFTACLSPVVCRCRLVVVPSSPLRSFPHERGSRPWWVVLYVAWLSCGRSPGRSRGHGGGGSTGPRRCYLRLVLVVVLPIVPGPGMSSFFVI